MANMAPSMHAAISSDHLIGEDGCKRRSGICRPRNLTESTSVIVAQIWLRCDQRGNRARGKPSVDN